MVKIKHNPKGYREDRGGDRDEIRQIQILMLLCLFLSREGTLYDLLKMALATPGQRTLNRLTPPEDISIDGLFEWLGELFGEAEVTEGERDLILWQNDIKNMFPAISELKAIEDKLGFKINIEKKI
ncbi:MULTISPECIES: DurN family substrate-assisted peptide maturase [unclassified Moorena]|uniref:DurN family substrate-assisted peptide maturase n=1 Tax=unclassified Moorena TaxID=2683338 RepID=UPI0013B6FAA6|nr:MULTISPECIES: DurN family substrate-assisted peptide maturase [unclassified Moorena]NEP36742.1 hypothetical protein [Moorena sp. SIO3B2]NEQ10861.1 hypothetical protein [Moorena sp. SIO4E2]